MADLMIFHLLKVVLKSRKPSCIVAIHWLFSYPGWLKIIIDGVAKGSPSPVGGCGFVHNCKGFV